ncbi:hypothetical protein H5410_008715 [Solanum commersonii]|uniref:Uncharacterized protein n=1 Tax=Solanum commersonii TaxID=4109 RepID=A0A9J6AGF3_SOLCO|nr:hypothetical protein H5410_008715 [Solanum commersonii]
MFTSERQVYKLKNLVRVINYISGEYKEQVSNRQFQAAKREGERRTKVSTKGNVNGCSSIKPPATLSKELPLFKDTVKIYQAVNDLIRASVAGGRLLLIYAAHLANNYVSKSWVTVYLSSDYFLTSNLYNTVTSFRCIFGLLFIFNLCSTVDFSKLFLISEWHSIMCLFSDSSDLICIVPFVFPGCAIIPTLPILFLFFNGVVPSIRTILYNFYFLVGS